MVSHHRPVLFRQQNPCIIAGWYLCCTTGLWMLEKGIHTQLGPLPCSLLYLLSLGSSQVSRMEPHSASGGRRALCTLAAHVGFCAHQLYIPYLRMLALALPLGMQQHTLLTRYVATHPSYWVCSNIHPSTGYAATHPSY